MAPMRLYTRTGDQGNTGLVDGSRIEKDHVRIASYGTVDELNSILALCIDSLKTNTFSLAPQCLQWILAIQNDLFTIGSELATPYEARWDGMTSITLEDITILEKLIDFCQSQVPSLKEFVLPGGTLSNCYFHVARTVCRRAERTIISLSKIEKINANIIPYINRLSDLLFALSRIALIMSTQKEFYWSKLSGVRSLSLPEGF